MSNIRPTPECDANAFVARKVINNEYHGLHDVIPLKLGEAIERERDEARERADAMDRLHTARMTEVGEELEAMREAIRFTLANHNLDPEACIAKLQPFLE